MFALLRSWRGLQLLSRTTQTRSGPGGKASKAGGSTIQWYHYRSTHLPTQSQSPPSDPTVAGSTPSLESVTDFSTLDLGFSPYPPIVLPPDSSLGIHPYPLTSNQEKDLLDYFFDQVHPAVPLFNRYRFMHLYGSGLVQHDLVITLAAVTARGLGPVSYWPLNEVDSCIKSLLALTFSEGDELSQSSNSLDRIRMECLLGYYEFHQLPGPSAWMRISRLVRKAHALGLNQIENPDLCSAFDASIASEDEIEDWRHVWWWLYCLDSYSNIASGVPFIVDADSINTSLVSRPLDSCLPLQSPPSMQKIFIEDDISELWKTAQEVVARDLAVGFNTHLVTTTILRRAGQLLRLRNEKGPGRIKNRVEALKRSLTSLKLALPPRYLEPCRHTLQNESEVEHNIRLANALHLHMANLILSLPSELAAGEEAWLGGLEQIRQASEDIASVVQQWDTRFNAQTDPAICFIVAMAFCVLNIYQRCMHNVPGHIAESATMLVLFLQQFGKHWNLSKMVGDHCENLQQSIPDTLSFPQVDHMLRRIKTPLSLKGRWRISGQPLSFDMQIAARAAAVDPPPFSFTLPDPADLLFFES
ncbi:hypothetical protein BX600DRAFT_515067 [Xylariales sp. PMI_506]|nr:hypothetical protein BX600DRAFT_515067 [Xylariales sp. PMI_506]